MTHHVEEVGGKATTRYINRYDSVKKSTATGEESPPASIEHTHYLKVIVAFSKQEEDNHP